MQQTKLSPPPHDGPAPVAQGLPFIHQNTPFLSQVNYEESKSQPIKFPNQQPVLEQNFENSEVNKQVNTQPQEVREEIQLLYVPLESLRQREQRQQFQKDHAAASSQIRFVDEQNLAPQAHKQVQLQNIEHDYLQQALQAQQLQQQFQQQPNSIHPEYQHFHRQEQPLEISTKAPAPKKRKPHQPPLAVYMESEGQESNDVTVADVLSLLKEAKSITVQDYVNENSPKVFVGPSNLQTPEGYVKFSLPYLSSLDKNKKDKIDKLPFFVAPLNYKTPAGYSKIPFPSPHVGSVIVNQRREETTEKEKTYPTLVSAPYLVEKNKQILYNEASTVPTINKNRQAFSTVFPHPAQYIEASTAAPDIPYGPIPVSQQQYNPVSSTTAKTYVLPQNDGPVHPAVHRFTSPAPAPTESYTPAPQVYSATTNRNSFKTPAPQPQVNLSVADVYYVDSKSESPNRYLPNINQQVSSTTHRQYIPEHIPSNHESNVHHRFTDNFKNQKNQHLRGPAHIRFEPVAIINQGVHMPTYYDTKTEKSEHRIVNKPKVVTESSFIHTQREQNIPVKNSGYQQVKQEVHQPDRHQAQELDTQHRFASNIQLNQPEQPTFVSTEKPHIQQYLIPHRNEQVTKIQYRLPADLPISPQLPSLVNSLEDQAIRPLLAPLLNLPSAEEAELSYFSPSEEPKVHPEHSTVQNIAPSVYTEPPHHHKIVYSEIQQEPTKLFNKNHEVYSEVSNIRSTPKVQTVSFIPYPESPEISSTTQAPPSRAPSTEHVVYVSATPEPPVETTTPYKRLRSRHRGTRPTTSPSTRTRTSSIHRGRRPYQELHKDTPENSRSTTERPTIVRSRYSSREKPTSTEYAKDINRDHQKRFRTRGRPVKLEEELTSHAERSSSSTESLVLVQPTKQYPSQIIQGVSIKPDSEKSSVEENKNYATNLQNDQPLNYLINGEHIINQNTHSAEVSPQIYVIKEETPISEEIKEHVKVNVQPPVQEPTSSEITRVQSSVDQSQYLVETTKPRTRTRSRTRGKTHTSTTTTKPSTTTAAEVKEQESSEEFYGFFRTPTFKPLKMEYKESSDIRATAVPVQQTASTPRYPYETNTYYVNNVRSSTPRVYEIHTEDDIIYENPNPHLIRVSSLSPDSYEDIKPVTIRTTPARRRFSTTPVIHDPTTSSPDRYYSTRSKTKPETQTQRATRIRGRIRRPVTPQYEKETSSEENYSVRSQQRETTTKLRNRGKVHFQLKDADKTEEDISENYPESFLRAQVSTARPSFKLTIEPEESFEEQEGAYSHHPIQKTKEVVKGEESQRYEKTVEGPNQIPLPSKGNVQNVTEAPTEKTTEVLSETLTDDSAESSTENTESNTSVTPDVTTTSTTEDSTELREENTTTQQTISSTEIIENMLKKKRRGTWRLVAHRPVDMFQPAESQNVGAVYVNNLNDEEKEYKKDKFKIDQMLADVYIENKPYDLTNVEDVNEEEIHTTTESIIDKTEDNNNSTTEENLKETTTEESGEGKEESFFDILVSSLEKLEDEKSEETSTEKEETDEDTTESDFFNQKIIGTSTTTEVSHETEICYKGRCVKSNM